MKKCILCGKETNGSVGRAGIRWQSICQECKNMEDDLAAAKLLSQINMIDRLTNLYNKEDNSKNEG